MGADVHLQAIRFKGKLSHQPPRVHINFWGCTTVHTVLIVPKTEKRFKGKDSEDYIIVRGEKFMNDELVAV